MNRQARRELIQLKRDGRRGYWLRLDKQLIQVRNLRGRFNTRHLADDPLTQEMVRLLETPIAKRGYAAMSARSLSDMHGEVWRQGRKAPEQIIATLFQAPANGRWYWRR